MKRISIAFLSLFLCVASVWSMPRPEYPRPQFERAGWVNPVSYTHLTLPTNREV